MALDIANPDEAILRKLCDTYSDLTADEVKELVQVIIIWLIRYYILMQMYLLTFIMK